jgi:predicted NAD/FAD-binding protein
LGAAFRLAKDTCIGPLCSITLYESNDYVGGHANTALIPKPLPATKDQDSEAGQSSYIPIDTGFMVFNKITYPHLTDLFQRLGVEISPTDMSFSVQHQASGLEYAGASLNRLFGQRRNVLNLRFWRMLMQLNRFNNEALLALDSSVYDDLTLEEYVTARCYGEDLLELYLVPMSSAVWSTPPELMLGFPAKTLLRFFHNHGFLGMNTQHQWWTVRGGSRNYVNRLIEAVKPSVKLNSPVRSVVRHKHCVEIVSDAGVARHDKAIIATHADQALLMLDAPELIEKNLLQHFSYQKNSAILHTDDSVMPESVNCWASWNYHLVAKEHSAKAAASTHYWMNSLQNLATDDQYFVSINAEHLVQPSKILRHFSYTHPLFSLDAVKAQKSLGQLNSQSPDQKVFFCGSYFRYGFHEDALVSGYLAADALASCAVLV